MAITRAQIAKQMLQNGGMLVQPGFGGARQGYRGEAAAASAAASDRGMQGRSVGSDPQGRGDGPASGRDPTKQSRDVDTTNLTFMDEKRRAVNPLGFLTELPGIYGAGFRALTPNPFGFSAPDFENPPDDRGGEDIQRLLYRRAMAQKTGTMDNAIEEDEEKEPVKIAPRFAAEGGRIGLQEGGGIEQRLEQLGGDVTSAEQVLQAINKRLETAESSLGSGGGMQSPFTDQGSIVPQGGGIGGLTRPINADLPDKLIPALNTPLVDNMGFNFRQEGDMGRYVADNDPGQQFAGYSSYQDYLNAGNDPVERKQGPQPLPAVGVETIQTGQPIQMSAQQALENQGRIPSLSLEQLYPNVGQKKIDPFPMRGGPEMFRNSGIPAAGYADGGDVVGGEFDFESARQMYGLGKLVKKVTKTVKKIAKSPIGKAALAAATIKFGGPLAAKFAPGTFGPAAKSPFLRAIGRGQFFGDTGIFSAGKNILFGTDAGIRSTPGLLSKFPGGGVGAGIFGASALAGLMTPEEEEESQAELAKAYGEPLDFKALRPYGPLRFEGVAAANGGRIQYQEGSKEPVAKKTMPLLDMGGKEMDLREEGGFVPIGRMEKADDVPARLSKNEFVFTADAVRNAGDGNVDKGAEVMYNMMKNLEAGGDVSEESQGLEGARKMFQTSQRLEEVL